MADSYGFQLVASVPFAAVARAHSSYSPRREHTDQGFPHADARLLIFRRRR